LLPSRKEAHEAATMVRPEWVVFITGIVNKRPEKMVNADEENGDIEIEVTLLTVLSQAETPPFEISEDTKAVDETLRLEYRYLDLRTKRLAKNIRMRSEFVRACRDFLYAKDFTEIETPLLSEATPEGARDFLVPSRREKGKFYALPQSPQQYKQLLMVAGFERYFQIARALRDEDLRADRGFEHTQIDIEMSFVEREDVLAIIEEMMIAAVEKLGFKVKEKPFPRISYKDALQKYGADKFDLRSEKEKEEGVLAYAWVLDFPLFERNDTGGWTFSHNPFSMPKPEHLADHLAGKNIENIISTQYDLVCNGYEAGGGSIRAHTSEILVSTYKIMGYSEERIQRSVGHMLEAFRYGAPPHGGIALGVERNIMNLAGESELREVQAFPMTRNGRTAVMNAPSEIDTETLLELGLKKTKE
ncbi:aspartate--tRNA ligase, partial [bacterium]|nr:aspartate--tRNA ligase [bacterium]